MTKEIYAVPGRINIVCVVTSIRNRKKYTSTETGTNSMSNVARDYKEKIYNAKLNAIYKYMNRGGGSDAVVEVKDFDITYFTNQIKIIKEVHQYKDKNGDIQRKRYAYGVDKTTNKRVNRARIIRKGTIDKFQ
jgi:hypothetical protein